MADKKADTAKTPKSLAAQGFSGTLGGQKLTFLLTKCRFLSRRSAKIQDKPPHLAKTA